MAVIENGDGFDNPENRIRQAGGKLERVMPGRANGQGRDDYGPAPRLKVLSAYDLLEVPAREYLIKGIMARTELSIIWGAPKSGKSFFMLHVAYALAQGRDVFGRRVSRPGAVLYVAAEGESGMAKRVRALHGKFGTSANIRFITQPVDLLHEEGNLDEIVRIANSFRADLIIIDTLSRAIAGGDENSSADMGQFIRALDILRNETGAHLAVIHHGTKDRSGATPRGHSSLIGAADLVVEVTKAEDGTRTATVTAAKDDPDGVSAWLRQPVIFVRGGRANKAARRSNPHIPPRGLRSVRRRRRGEDRANVTRNGAECRNCI